MNVYFTLVLFLISIAGFSQEEYELSQMYTAVIKNHNYSVFTGFDGTYLIKDNDTILHLDQYYFAVGFKDLNQDGYKDLLLDLGGNIPERYDLMLFDPKKMNFIEIKDFQKFPAPKMIRGTRYYYSYHKSGCADNNWDSDLFYIKGDKVIKLGTISGRECDNSGMTDGLYVYKLTGNGKKLYKTFPIQIIYKYKEGKWGFIKQYWERNFKGFVH